MITRKLDELTPGKYIFDGEVITVLGLAQHTEADYKLVIFHPEENRADLRAMPESAFLERMSNGLPRFERME